MKNIILMLLVNILVITNSSASDQNSSINNIKNSGPKNILFIGNSYLYYNDSLHNHFKRIVEERFPDYDGGNNVKSSTIGGSRLKHHNLEHLLGAKSISSVDRFDLVILQGGSGESLSKNDREEFFKAVKKHIDKIQSIGSDAALYMIHSYVEPHEKYSPNLIRTIEKMYTKAGKDNNALVIPVGLAFEYAYKLRPTIKLHKMDGTHPDILGTYLAACVVYASIFKDNPIGLNYNYNGKISSDDKLFLQRVAHETVEKYFN